MAKIKPAFKIGDTVLYMALSGFREAEVIAIYGNPHQFSYKVITKIIPVKVFAPDPPFEICIKEKDLYKPYES